MSVSAMVMSGLLILGGTIPLQVNSVKVRISHTTADDVISQFFESLALFPIGLILQTDQGAIHVTAGLVERSFDHTAVTD